MSNLKYKTHGNTEPQKPNIYFCCHPKDFEKYFETISNDIFFNELLANHPCTIWYADKDAPRDEAFLSDLAEMQMFVIPITTNFLCADNVAMQIEFPFAMAHHIPVLPIMMESQLDDIFNEKSGGLHYLDKNSHDPTAIDYAEKLNKFLALILCNKGLEEKIRAAFDVYIFLSYRKKDRKYANKLLRTIHSITEYRDVAVWFDEFLIPGESFNKNIESLLDKCKLFTLIITPHIAEKTVDKDGNEVDNYVISKELPLAQKKKAEKGTEIFAIQMEQTDKTILQSLSIENCVTFDAKNFRQCLIEALSNIAKSPNNSPEHSFFIGLAYLSGIDVEINYEFALNLITEAADANFEPAVSKLADMYYYGIGTAKDTKKALPYYRQLSLLRKQLFIDTGTEDVATVWIDTQYMLGTVLLKERQYAEAKQCFAELYNNCKKLYRPSIFSWQGRSLMRTTRKFPYALYGKGLSAIGLAKIANHTISDPDKRFNKSLHWCYTAEDAFEDYEDEIIMSHTEDQYDLAQMNLGLAEARLGLGTIDDTSEMRDYKIALNYLEKARKISNSELVNQKIYDVCVLLVEACISHDKYDQAGVYFNRATSALNDSKENSKENKSIDSAYLSLLYGKITVRKIQTILTKGFSESTVPLTVHPVTQELVMDATAYMTKERGWNWDEIREATASIMHSLSILEPFPLDPELRTLDTAYQCYWNLGLLSDLTNASQAAIEPLKKACVIAEQLCKMNANWNTRLQEVHSKLAKVYGSCGDYQKQRYHNEMAGASNESEEKLLSHRLSWHFATGWVYDVRNELINLGISKKSVQLPKNFTEYTDKSIEELKIWIENILPFLQGCLDQYHRRIHSFPEGSQIRKEFQSSFIRSIEQLAKSLSKLSEEHGRQHAILLLQGALMLYGVLKEYDSWKNYSAIYQNTEKKLQALTTNRA